MNESWYLNWWINQMDIDDHLMSQLRLKRDSNIFKPDIGYKELEQRYLMSLSLPFDRHITFDKCASNIINRLFSENVDDDTLVITTGSEHPSVVSNLQKCLNVIKVTTDDKLKINFDIISYIRKFKKVFIYMIGLSMGNNYQTSQEFIIKLKNILVENGIPHKIVIDAVQELFLLPRDYRIYDYVIGTAHALIPNFNMGIVISKEQYAEMDIQNGYDFYRLLNILIPRKNLLFMFNYIMTQEFLFNIQTDSYLDTTKNCPYIFTLTDKLNRLDGIQEVLGQKPEYSLVTFRACNDFIMTDRMFDKVRKIKQRLNDSI